MKFVQTRKDEDLSALREADTKKICITLYYIIFLQKCQDAGTVKLAISK